MANFGANFITIPMLWPAFKNLVALKKLAMQFDFIESDGMYKQYQIFAIDNSIVYLCDLWEGEKPPGISVMTQAENDEWYTDFDSNHQEQCNQKIATLTTPANAQSDNAQKVTLVGREGSEVIYATHNFCDKTTWFTDSVAVTSGSLFNSGDNLTFSGSHTHWIDLEHGKVMDEEGAMTDFPSTDFSVQIFVDGIQKTPRIPFENTGGDFTINYPSGTITFTQMVTGSVTANYHYASSSLWILAPTTGRALDIEQAEVQFSQDVIINDTVIMSIWGNVEVFSPQNCTLNGGNLTPGTKVKLAQTHYKHIHQYIDEALGSYPVIPAIGGSNGRGMESSIYGFPFRYGAVKRLYNSYGMQVRFQLANNKVFGGERTTATFYCVSRPEAEVIGI